MYRGADSSQWRALLGRAQFFWLAAAEAAAAVARAVEAAIAVVAAE